MTYLVVSRRPGGAVALPFALAVIALSPVALSSCAPSLPDDSFRITGQRLLAVRFEPAEAEPGAQVTAHALVASPDGTVVEPVLDWALCEHPKSPAENRTVDPACVTEPGTGGVAAVQEEESSASFVIPGDACALFGPETPPGDFRPRDPDVTGGFFLPVRATLEGEGSIALLRLACNLRSIPISVALALREHYVANRNPTLGEVAMMVSGARVIGGSLPPGEAVRLEAPFAAGDDERYVHVDPGSLSVVSAEESLRFSWYATAGTFEADRTAPDIAPADPAAPAPPGRSVNVWRPGAEPGPVHFWVVVRDSRGGADFSAWDAVVRAGGSE